MTDQNVIAERERLINIAPETALENEAAREARHRLALLGAKILLHLVYGALALLCALFLAADLYHHRRTETTQLLADALWRLGSLALSLGVSIGFFAWSIPKMVSVMRAKQSESDSRRSRGHAFWRLLITRAACSDKPRETERRD